MAAAAEAARAVLAAEVPGVVPELAVAARVGHAAVQEPVEARHAVALGALGAPVALNVVAATSVAPAVRVVVLNAVASDKVCHPADRVQVRGLLTRMQDPIPSDIKVPGEPEPMPVPVERAEPPAAWESVRVRVPELRDHAEPAVQPAEQAFVPVSEQEPQGPVAQPVESEYAPVQEPVLQEPASQVAQEPEARPVGSVSVLVRVQAQPEQVVLPAELAYGQVPEQARPASALVPPAQVAPLVALVFAPVQERVPQESVDRPVESATSPVWVPAHPEPPERISTPTPTSPHKQPPFVRRPIRITAPPCMRVIPMPGTPTIGHTVPSITTPAIEPSPRHSACPAHRCRMTTAPTSCTSRAPST